MQFLHNSFSTMGLWANTHFTHQCIVSPLSFFSDPFCSCWWRPSHTQKRALTQGHAHTHPDTRTQTEDGILVFPVTCRLFKCYDCVPSNRLTWLQFNPLVSDSGYFIVSLDPSGWVHWPGWLVRVMRLASKSKSFYGQQKEKKRKETHTK